MRVLSSVLAVVATVCLAGCGDAGDRRPKDMASLIDHSGDAAARGRGNWEGGLTRTPGYSDSVYVGSSHTAAPGTGNHPDVTESRDMRRRTGIATDAETGVAPSHM